MTLIELKDILDKTDMPVAYMKFKKTPTLPYVAFYLEATNPFTADDGALVYIDDYVVDLFTEVKDVEAETRLELELERNEIIWTKSESYEEDAKVFMITYAIKTMRTKEN